MLTLMKWVKVLFEKPPPLSIPIEIHSDSHQHGSHQGKVVYADIDGKRIPFPDHSVRACLELIERLAEVLDMDVSNYGEKVDGDKRIQLLEMRNEK